MTLRVHYKLVIFLVTSIPLACIRHSKKTAFTPLKHTKISLTCPFLHGFSAFLKIHGILETSCFQAIMTTGSAGGLFGPYKGPLPAVRLKTR